MGILTELFVATDEEARCYDGQAAGRFRSVHLGGLTNLEFETLWAVLEATEWNPNSHVLQAIRPPGGTWTFKSPAAFVERLRELDSDGIAPPTELWAATEELACDPAEVEPVIVTLVAVARSFGTGGPWAWHHSVARAGCPQLRIVAPSSPWARRRDLSPSTRTCWTCPSTSAGSSTSSPGRGFDTRA